MSGVGSTNAMKKGSANNPFLAYSEADMQGFLNSAYTGCIVKYAGEPISRYLTEQNKTVPEHVKNLVFSPTDGGFWEFFNSGNIRIKIQQKTNGSTKTLYITPGRFYNLAWHFNKYDFTNGNLYLTDSLTAPTEIPTEIQKYFDTEPYWRWNKECVNDQGNLTIWTYDQDVTFTIEQATTEYGIGYEYTHGITIVPYKVNELYKVVYSNGEYYYEEFCHISDTRTTANSDYIAPGKTAYDFTGNLQTGNGSKINPYLAYTLAEFQSFPVGSFIKWLGPGKTVIDATTGQMLIHNEVYRAVEDGDILQYVILPTLTNEATAEDVTAGKEFINSNGQKVVGTKAAKPIYGVSGLYQSDPALTRTDDAVGMSWTMNDNIILSDFDDVFPYNQMVRKTIDGDVFVKIPAMYFRIGRNSDGYITDLAVSEDKMIAGENQVVAHVDAFYFGAYGASVLNEKMYSKTGVARTSRVSCGNFRTYAKARGTKYRQLDLYHMRVLDFLWLIEFATKDSDAVMRGYTSDDGTCGATDNLTVPSGQLSSDGRMRWRYIEDFVGNGLEFFDGAYGLGATQDESKYGQQVTDVTYLPTPNGHCLSALKISDTYPLLAVPGESVKNSYYDTFFCDFVNCASGDIVYSHGRCYSGVDYGLFRWDSYNAPGEYAAIGSRLLLIP